jgi:hypothetical protein
VKWGWIGMIVETVFKEGQLEKRSPKSGAKTGRKE